MKFRLIERVLNEDIESMKKYFPNIPDEQFQSLIELDPTYKPGSKNAGNYGRWILTLANKGKLDNLGHVKDLLTRFNDESKYLKNKDIMRYKTMDEVEDMLNDEDSYKEQSHRQEVRDRQKARKNADLGNEAKKVYVDSDWEVWVPLTYAASCKLGQGASWCTASTESDYYYNHYKNAYGGEYYININKHDPEEKYQFHFESNQFMDVDDDEIDLSGFLSKNSGLKKLDNDIIYSSYVKSWGIKEDGSAVVSASDLAGVLSSRDMSEDFLESCFRGDIFEYFMDYGNYTDNNVIENYYLSETNKENVETIESITGLDVNERGFLEAVEEEYPDVYEAIKTACSDAEVTGAENECYEDFNSSLNSASRPLIVNWEFSGGDDVFVKVNMVYLKDNCIDVISYVSEEGRDSNDFSSVVSSFMSNDWDFSEPRYGWSGFDADTYNDRLADELYNLDVEIDEEDVSDDKHIILELSIEPERNGMQVVRRVKTNIKFIELNGMEQEAQRNDTTRSY